MGPNQAKYAYATNFNLETGRLILMTDAPPEDVAVLRARFPEAVEVIENAGPRGRANTRNNDTAPHYGGAAISRAVPGGTEFCSVGIVVTIPGVGQRMVTAGHCGAVNTQWRSGNGANAFGVITNNSLQQANTWDQALITNNSAARIYQGSSTTGTWAAQTGPGANATAAGTYFTSGRSGTIGHALNSASHSPAPCIDYGAAFGGVHCYAGLTSLTTDVPGGDSASPSWSEQRGGKTGRIVIAGNGTLVFCEPWTRIQALWTPP